MSPPTPILLLVNSLARGGAERLVVDLATRLPAHGFTASVGCVMGAGPFEARLQAAGIPVHQLGRKPGRPGVRAILRAARLARGHALVHTHLWSADTWGRLGAALAGTPVVTTEHNINRDETLRHRVVKRQLAGVSARLVAVSEMVREYMEDWEGLPPERIRVINNGIDLAVHEPGWQARATRADWRTQGGGPVIGMLGRLAPQKQVDVGIRAFPRILRHFPDAVLEIGGSGPLRADLEALARSLGIDAQVRFLGDLEEPAAAMARWDLLLHTPAWEGFGLVVAEAMASGLPVVASGVGGVPQVMADRHTGRLFPPGREEPLVDAVVEVLRDERRWQRFSRTAHQRAVKLFDVERMVAEYAALYREVLA